MKYSDGNTEALTDLINTGRGYRQRQRDIAQTRLGIR
jgi:hypothetical protein